MIEKPTVIRRGMKLKLTSVVAAFALISISQTSFAGVKWECTCQSDYISKINSVEVQGKNLNCKRYFVAWPATSIDVKSENAKVMIDYDYKETNQNQQVTFAVSALNNNFLDEIKDLNNNGAISKLGTNDKQNVTQKTISNGTLDYTNSKLFVSKGLNNKNQHYTVTVWDFARTGENAVAACVSNEI